MSEAIEAPVVGLTGGSGAGRAAIRTVAVIGCGTMGQGISEVIAARGMTVRIIEQSERDLRRGMALLSSNLDHAIERWSMTASEKRAILARVDGTVDLTMAEEADLVVEAIDEVLDHKQTLFRELDMICPEETIFITNTATLSVTEIAAVTRRQDRVVGLHFLNPVPKIPVVEVVRGLKTSDETLDRAKRFAALLDKTPVEVFEYPGYITTRVIVPMLNEAMHLVMEGVATPEGIDTAMKLGFNLTMGPLALADMMGLDEVMQWMESLFRELGDSKYRPCPLLRKMVRAGHLGRKSGRGFFPYDEAGHRN